MLHIQPASQRTSEKNDENDKMYFVICTFHLSNSLSFYDDIFPTIKLAFIAQSRYSELSEEIREHKSDSWEKERKIHTQ